MSDLIKCFRRDERGATATEYAMLIVFVAVAVAFGATTLGSDLSSLFSQIGTYVSGITLPPKPPTP